MGHLRLNKRCTHSLDTPVKLRTQTGHLRYVSGQGWMSSESRDIPAATTKIDILIMATAANVLALTFWPQRGRSIGHSFVWQGGNG